MAALYDLEFQRLLSLSEERIQNVEARAAVNSGRAQPDLMGMVIVNIQRIIAIRWGIAEALQQHAGAEYAYIETIGTPPPGDIGTTTPYGV